MCSHDDDHIIVVALLYNYITIQVRTGVRTKCLFYPLHQQKHTHTQRPGYSLFPITTYYNIIFDTSAVD